MTSKANALQAALASGRTRTAQPEAAQLPAEETGQGGAPATAGRPPSRADKVNISGWFSPSYKRSMRMVQAITDRKLEALLAEAMNDLFQKYDVPQVRED